MDKDFQIAIGDDGIPYQLFNGKRYKLYPGRRYFMQHKHHMHQKVWEHFNGERKAGFHIHHKDGNSWNNRIDNLEEIPSNKHLSEHAKKKFEDKEWHKQFHAKGIEAAKAWHKSPEGIEWHRQHAKNNNFGQQKHRQKQCEQCGKEYTAKTSHSKFCHQNCKAKALRARYKQMGKSLRPNDRRNA